jgi:methionyl-tRNA formyltransferase
VLFCGDRAVSVELVSFLRRQGATIVALGINDPRWSPYGEAIRAASGLADDEVYVAKAFKSAAARERLAAPDADLGVCCGFDTILPGWLLRLPRWGWVNLHRSYLPLNRGLDPLQWALIDETAVGVTLHVMTEEVDAGPIIDQEQLACSPTDTGETLSGRADQSILHLFARNWPRLATGSIEARRQNHDAATYHSMAECLAIRRLDVDELSTVGRVLAVLRAYSFNSEGRAFFRNGGAQYSVRIIVEPASLSDSPATEISDEAAKTR